MVKPRNLSEKMDELFFKYRTVVTNGERWQLERDIIKQAASEVPKDTSGEQASPAQASQMTKSETQLTLLEKQIIEALDDYHDRGLFHEYTPLEKKRYAAFITALFTQALTSVTELACDKCRVRMEDKLNNGVLSTSEPRELLCELCDSEYCVWFAPNPLWNKVMRHPDGREASERYKFVCPTCFTKEAEKLGITPIWKLGDEKTV